MKISQPLSFLAVVLGLLAMMLGACPSPNGADAKEGSSQENRSLEVHYQSDSGTKEAPKKAVPEVDLFDPQTILKIEVELPLSEWDELRKQARNYDNFLVPGCMSKPWGSNFTYRKSTITIQGKVLKDVGIRKKGFVGSISAEKPSLKLKFNEFVDKQKLFGRSRMSLNNNRQDASFIRSCLAYYVFSKAGVPAPRCRFAHVFINGKSLGVYSYVEDVKKPFLERHFSSKDGQLYEGTLSDFRQGWSATYEPKTKKTAPDIKMISDMMAALKLPKEELLKALTPLVDIDKFILFWAVEVLVHHWDGYAGNNNNHFIYKEPSTKKILFIPWGPDATFQKGSRAPKGAPSWVLARGILARRLYELSDTRAKYVAQMKKLLGTIWKEAGLIKEIDRMEKLLAPFVADDILHGKSKFSEQVNQVRDFVKGRRKQLEPVLTNPPEWNVKPRNPLCFSPTGESRGHFSTTFGSLEVKDLFSQGNGEIKGKIGKDDIPQGKTTSVAGFEQNAKDQVVIRVIQQLSSTRFLVAGFIFFSSEVSPDGKVTLRGPLKGGKSYLIEFDGVTRKSKVIGLLWSGSLSLSKSGSTKGEPVIGTFAAKWVSPSQ